MGGRQRYLRPLVLFILMALFSFSSIGQSDSRLYIGGFDWEFDVTEAYSDGILNSTTDLQAEVSPYEPIETVSDETVIQVDNAANNNGAEKTTEVANAPIDNTVPAKAVVSDIPTEETPKPQTEREKPTILIHKVSKGETLWDIAKSYGITVDSILSANNITNSNRINVGQELQILTVAGVLHEVAYGESVWEISQRYNVALEEIIKVNNISDPSLIQPRDQLVIPGATKLLRKDALVVNGVLQKAFEWPTAKARISSNYGERWGRMHNGLDIAVVTGTPVRAAADGRVTYSGAAGTYGILVTIDHGNGVETRYAHNSRTAAKVGQTVKRGDIVAYSGNTGNSTGPHLHFEIRYKGNPVDPMKYLK